MARRPTKRTAMPSESGEENQSTESRERPVTLNQDHGDPTDSPVVAEKRRRIASAKQGSIGE